MNHTGGQRPRHTALRDLILVTALTLVTYLAAARYDLAERLRGWLDANERHQFDEAAVALIALTLGLSLFGSLRWSERRREQGARSSIESRYRQLVEQVPAITYVWETRGRIGTDSAQYVSPQIESVLGFDVDEWQAQPDLWLKLIHPDDRRRVLSEWDQALAQETAFRSEYRIHAKDGRLVWLRDEAAAVADERGDRVLQGVMLDVTEEKRAERRYRQLVEQLPAVVYLDGVDEVSTAIYMSPKYEELTGYTAKERVANADLWVRSLHPDDREWVLAESERTNETGDPFICEYRMVRRDGGVIWVRDEARLVRGEDGGPWIWQGVLLDVTERKRVDEQLREAEQRYRSLVETLPLATYIDTAEEPPKSVYVSPQVEEMIGYTPEEWKANPQLGHERLHPDDRDRVLAEDERTDESGEPYEVEYRFLAKDGHEVWLHEEASLVRDPDGTPRFWQGILYDITEHKIVEQALEERERREREAADRLRALDDMKNTFLAAVSHELRSPLTSILGLSLTLERHDRLSESDRADLLGRLAANARKLDRLLKDLLDIDRLSRGIVAPQYRLTDLGALVRRTIESLDSVGERAVIVRTEPVLISVDPAKVERIVENLVTNAVRHTSQQSTIWVRVVPRDAGALVVVEDDGPGIPEDIRNEIFQPFRQGPAVSSANPGTGIGLSLVARFAELHGGRAWAGEREGGGAAFHVFLPGTPEEARGDAIALGGTGPPPASRESYPPADSADAG